MPRARTAPQPPPPLELPLPPPTAGFRAHVLAAASASTSVGDASAAVPLAPPPPPPPLLDDLLYPSVNPNFRPSRPSSAPGWPGGSANTVNGGGDSGAPHRPLPLPPPPPLPGVGAPVDPSAVQTVAYGAHAGGYGASAHAWPDSYGGGCGHGGAAAAVGRAASPRAATSGSDCATSLASLASPRPRAPGESAAVTAPAVNGGGLGLRPGTAGSMGGGAAGGGEDSNDDLPSVDGDGVFSDGGASPHGSC